MPEPLAPQDATLWCAQDRDAPLQIGAVCRFERAPLLDADGNLRVDDLRRNLETRLALVPRFRQRLRPIPFGLGAPVWVDDPDFEVTNHLHLAELPAPGGDAALRRFVNRVLEVPLDPSRPLWEMWLVDGLADETVAVVAKVSHVMADGMSLVNFALLTLDAEPGIPPYAEPEPWDPEPPPPAPKLLVEGVLDEARRVVDVGVGAARAVADPRRFVSQVAGIASAAMGTIGLAPRVPITAPVGPRRDFVSRQLSLDDLNAVRKTEGATLNDVVLTIAAGALHRYLQDTPGAQPGRGLRALVPVSTHNGAEAGEVENRFSILSADLPAADVTPRERLRQIHAQMVRRKGADEAALGPVLFHIGELVPERLLSWAAPPLLRRQPVVNLAITNVPGTPEPLYMYGARLLELAPVITVTGNIAVIIGVVSYRDSLGVGITVDADVVPDVDWLGDSVVAATDELVDAVLGPRSPDRPATTG
jgi:diacylglycerol O-acyltransferase / wax synthase